jgi:hypothetical protein
MIRSEFMEKARDDARAKFRAEMEEIKSRPNS